MSEQYKEIMERVKGAEPMIDILKSAPEEKRDIARLALTFYASGISAGLALNEPAPRPTA